MTATEAAVAEAVEGTSNLSTSKSSINPNKKRKNGEITLKTQKQSTIKISLADITKTSSLHPAEAATIQEVATKEQDITMISRGINMMKDNIPKMTPTTTRKSLTTLSKSKITINMPDSIHNHLTTDAKIGVNTRITEQ